MTIHFVYAGYPGDPRIQSPYSITNNLYNYLAARADVKYYEWTTGVDIDYAEDDIIIGHPFYDPNSVMQRVFRNDKPCKAKCLIHPLHHNRVEDNFPFNWMAVKADKIFSICGPYWYDTLDGTPFSHWKSKIVRLDMAVDLQTWSYRKQAFHSPHNRRILYVGSSMPQKNLGFLTQILERFPRVSCSWYGGSLDHSLAKLPNMHVVGWTAFTPEIIQDIVYKHDLFVNTSISDANPTTLLEFCLASGIIPICTQTSGYYNDPCFVNIPLDLEPAIDIVNEWLNKPPEELATISRSNRSVCEAKYTWENFCSTVYNTLSTFF